jgi:hypothetical protein
MTGSREVGGGRSNNRKMLERKSKKGKGKKKKECEVQ